jgi:hypothetical protein
VRDGLYADGMHLDVTPTLLIAELDPRLSHLFHAKEEEPPLASSSPSDE